MDWLHDFATIFSLSLTMPTVLGCLYVIWLWYAPALRAWRTKHREETNWLILGVVVGFIGSFGDNLYWGYAWTSHFYGWPATQQVFDSGVYSNVFFRQVCTVFAAYCHIRAAIATTSTAFRALMCFSILSAVLTAAVLVTSRVSG